MSLHDALGQLGRVISDQAERDPAFAKQLSEALRRAAGEATALAQSSPGRAPRRGNRRAPALIDPVELAKENQQKLEAALSDLDLEQLRDIVADFGMDTDKLAMKWKNPEKVRERILEVAMARARKGDAFRAS